MPGNSNFVPSVVCSLGIVTCIKGSSVWISLKGESISLVMSHLMNEFFLSLNSTRMPVPASVPKFPPSRKPVKLQ